MDSRDPAQRQKRYGASLCKVLMRCDYADGVLFGDGVRPPEATFQLEPCRAHAILENIERRIAIPVERPQDLTNDDLTELCYILQVAIKSHPADYKVSAHMLKTFVEEIFKDWASSGDLLPLPGAPKMLPYYDSGVDDPFTYNNGCCDEYLFYSEQLNRTQGTYLYILAGCIPDRC